MIGVNVGWEWSRLSGRSEAWIESRRKDKQELAKWRIHFWVWAFKGKLYYRLREHLAMTVNGVSKEYSSLDCKVQAEREDKGSVNSARKCELLSPGTGGPLKELR